MIKHDRELLKVLQKICRGSANLAIQHGRAILQLQSRDLLQLLIGMEDRVRDLEQRVDSQVCCWDEHTRAEEAETSAKFWRARYRRLYRDLVRAGANSR